MHGYRIPNAKVKSTSAKHEALLDRLICRGVLGFQELVEAEELATTVSRRADHIGLRVPRPTSFGELAPSMTSRPAPVRGSGSVSDNPNYQTMASFCCKRWPILTRQTFRSKIVIGLLGCRSELPRLP